MVVCRRLLHNSFRLITPISPVGGDGKSLDKDVAIVSSGGAPSSKEYLLSRSNPIIGDEVEGSELMDWSSCVAACGDNDSCVSMLYGGGGASRDGIGGMTAAESCGTVLSLEDCEERL